jgi:alpha-tubulin suppressor-like RCC1 family protein
VFTKLAAGYTHACALGTSGALTCWGGSGGAVASPPTGTFSDIASGQGFSCGIRNGELLCWGSIAKTFALEGGSYHAVAAGRNHVCAIGSGDQVDCFNSIGQTSGPSGTFKSIDSSDGFSCGITTYNTVSCWGAGAPTTPSIQASRVTCGTAHACAINNNGEVQCWGDNSQGQGKPPIGVFLDISAFGYRTCGIREDGHAFCWGAEDPSLGENQAPLW